MYICGEVFKTSRYIHYSTITTMIIINDPLRLLNLNTLAIYLMLTPDEKAQYRDKLKDLNRYSSLTKGIFHFDVVEKGDTPYDKLPEEMIRNMSHFNILVRLVNSIHGIYCYGMEEVDLGGDMHSIVERLKVFVKNVCEVNINHLDILHLRQSLPSLEILRYYSEKNIAKEMFEAALNGADIDKANGKRSLQETAPGADIKTSLGIAESAADSKKENLDKKIEKERCQNIRPDRRPNITMTVKKVNTDRVLKDGRIKKKLGVEMNIDGNIVPVYFGSTDQTFLYIIVLLAKLEGHELESNDFLSPESYYKYQPNLDSKHPIISDKQYRHKKVKTWLKNRYRALRFNRDFEDWYLGVKNNLHTLYVAMTGIKQTLWDALCLEYKDAYYYSLIYKDHGRYRIRISPSNIRIDPEIMERILETKDEKSEDWDHGYY